MEKILPKNWVETEFKELAAFVIGGDWGKDLEFEFDVDSEIVFCIRGSEIKNWERDKGSTASIRKIKSSSLEKRALVEGDILLEISGGGPDQPVGRTIYIDEEALDVNTDYKKVCTNFLRMVRLYDNLDKKFIKHYLDSFYLSGEILKYQGGSNNLRNLKYKEFETIKVPLPPLAEQQRIVAKLDDLFRHLDNLKTRLNHIPQILKNFRQAVLTQAVTGNLTEEWRKGKELDTEYFKEIESLHSKKKKPVKVRGKKGFNEELKLYDIPKQWNWIPNFKLTVDGGNAICAGPFGTIFKAKDFRDEGVPIIFLRHVKKEGFNQNKPKYMEPSVWKVHHQEYSIYGGELLITKLGDPPGEATIFPNDFGTAMVTPDVMKANYNDNIFSTKYASFFFNSKVCKDLVAEISFGMTRLRIDLTMFKSFPIAVPSKEEQTEIVKRVEALFAKADAIETQYQSLKTKIDSLPQAILAKAFKGELVEQLDTDGDAKELLEEIQQLKEALKPVKKTVKRKKK